MIRFPMGKTGFFGCLISLWLVPFAFGQAVPRKPFPKEPLEKLEQSARSLLGNGRFLAHGLGVRNIHKSSGEC